MLDEYGLTMKQRAFCDFYLETGNASEAARRAGYSAKTADVIGKQNLGKLPIKQYIAERLKPRQDQHIATADEVLQYLTRVMIGAEKDQFGLDASLQDRTKAAQELLKRYAVADDRQRSTMARLDSMFAEFRLAVSTAPTEPQESAQTAATVQGDSTEGSTQQDDSAGAGQDDVQQDDNTTA